MKKHDCQFLRGPAADKVFGEKTAAHIVKVLAEGKQLLMCLDSSINRMLEICVLKNLIQRTSQRVKLTAGARDIINSLSLFN